jgi:protein-disulfide isomerase
VKEGGGKVRVVYKNMVVHPQVVQKAHLAGCAASKQGKFLEFKHDWWDKAYLPYQQARDPSKLGEESILKIAQDLHLNVDQFKKDMESPDCQQRVQGDMAELAKFKVNSTPSFFVNGTHVGGALGKEQFKAMIDDKIKAVESSGTPCGEYYDKEIMGKGEKQFKSKKQGEGAKPG